MNSLAGKLVTTRGSGQRRSNASSWGCRTLLVNALVLWGCNQAPAEPRADASSGARAEVREILRFARDKARAAATARRSCAETSQELRTYAHALLELGRAVQVPEGWQGVPGVSGPGARLAPTAAIGLASIRQRDITFQTREPAYASWKSTVELHAMVYPDRPVPPMNLAIDRRLPWSAVVEALQAQPTNEVFLVFPAKARSSPPTPSGERWALSNATAAFYLSIAEPACRAEPPFYTFSSSVDEQRANIEAVLTAYQSAACNCGPNPVAMKEGFWHLYHGKGIATATRRVRLAKHGDARAVSLSAPRETMFEAVVPELLKLADADRPIAVFVDGAVR